MSSMNYVSFQIFPDISRTYCLHSDRSRIKFLFKIIICLSFSWQTSNFPASGLKRQLFDFGKERIKQTSKRFAIRHCFFFDPFVLLLSLPFIHIRIYVVSTNEPQTFTFTFAFPRMQTWSLTWPFWKRPVATKGRAVQPI